MNKPIAITVFATLFFIGLTFILIYVQLYDDYVAALHGGKGYIVFLMVMAAISLLILVLIGGWLAWEMLRGKRVMKKKQTKKKYSDIEMEELRMKPDYDEDEGSEF